MITLIRNASINALIVVIPFLLIIWLLVHSYNYNYSLAVSLIVQGGNSVSLPNENDSVVSELLTRYRELRKSVAKTGSESEKPHNLIKSIESKKPVETTKSTESKSAKVEMTTNGHRNNSHRSGARRNTTRPPTTVCRQGIHGRQNVNLCPDGKGGYRARAN